MTDPSADRQAINDLLVAYGKAVDAGEFSVLSALFTHDATAELGGSGQSGIAEIIERVSTALGRFERWEHHLGDPEVSIEGPTATARCPVHALHFRPGDGTPAVYVVDGTYEDQLVRTRAGWRISHRSLAVTSRG